MLMCITRVLLFALWIEYVQICSILPDQLNIFESVEFYIKFRNEHFQGNFINLIFS